MRSASSEKKSKDWFITLKIANKCFLKMAEMSSQ